MVNTYTEPQQYVMMQAPMHLIPVASQSLSETNVSTKPMTSIPEYSYETKS